MTPLTSRFHTLACKYWTTHAFKHATIDARGVPYVESEELWVPCRMMPPDTATHTEYDYNYRPASMENFPF